MEELRIWYAGIPGIFGYGLWVFDTCKDEAVSRLREAFTGWRDSYNVESDSLGWYTFEEAWDYFGGKVEQIDGEMVYKDLFAY